MVYFVIYRDKAMSNVPIDLDKTISMLEPDKGTDGGLQLPGKDRVVFRPSERKSLLGMCLTLLFAIIVVI